MRVLLVENSEQAATDIRQALVNTTPVPLDLFVARDGHAAMMFLHGTNVPRPDLVLLAWNLPGLHGSAVLASMQSDPGLAVIPVIVVSESDSEEELVEAFATGAQRFMTRPGDSKELERMMGSVIEFWATVSAAAAKADG